MVPSVISRPTLPPKAVRRVSLGLAVVSGLAALFLAVLPVRAADFAGVLDPSLKLGSPAAIRLVHFGCGSLVAPRQFDGRTRGLIGSQHMFEQDSCDTARHGRGLPVDYFVAAAVAAALAAAVARWRRSSTFVLGATVLLLVFAAYFTAIMGRATGPLG